MTFLPDEVGEGSVGTSPLLEISNAIVHLYKTAFGRGPTHARARFAGADLLVVVLHDTMTASERRLVALGQHQPLREHRFLLRSTVEDEMRAAVERILSRTPLALISGIDIERDVAVETFVLAPIAPPV